MKTIISTFLPAVTVAAIPLGLLAGSDSAATIYSDNFPGLSTSPLNGTVTIHRQDTECSKKRGVL